MRRESFWQRSGDDLYLYVHLSPRASRPGFGDVIHTEIKVKVSAPPVDDRANTALIKLVANHFDVSPSKVNIVSGHHSRHKTIKINGSRIDPRSLSS